jgi:hypothetical protein
MISLLGEEKLSLVEIETFLAVSKCVRFAGFGRAEIYGWVERLLCHHEYPLQQRRCKGQLRACVKRERLSTPGSAGCRALLGCLAVARVKKHSPADPLCLSKLPLRGRYRGRATHATCLKHDLRPDKKMGVNPGPQWKRNVEMAI